MVGGTADAGARSPRYGGRSSEQKPTEKVANKMDTATRNMMGPSRRLPRGNICRQVAEWNRVSEMLPSLSFW